MPVWFRILPARGLSYVRYEGVVRFAETGEAIAAYMRDPEMRPGQNQLIDLGSVTDWDRDFATLLKLQAAKADIFVGSRQETMLVYYAPTPHSQKMARMVMRSWEDIPGIIPLVQETEAGALNLLAQPETTFAEMLQNA